jgi:hypothetical protein
LINKRQRRGLAGYFICLVYFCKLCQALLSALSSSAFTLSAFSAFWAVGCSVWDADFSAPASGLLGYSFLASSAALLFASASALALLASSWAFLASAIALSAAAFASSAAFAFA